jgi:alternate signal-mediated exported protein
VTPSHTPRHRAATRRRLPRAASGAVVATVAVVLLVGPSGSLAYWRTAGSIPGGSPGAGALALTPNPGCTAWTLTQTGGPSGWTGSSYPGSATNAATTKYVEPNDTLNATCTYTLKAAGTHLRGAFTLVQPAGAPAGATATATYTVAGATQTTFTAADNGKAVVATVTLTLPSTSTATQGGSFTLSGASISAKQVHA